jgi:hypothetical protein
MSKVDVVEIDMARYDESLPVVDQCRGCEKIFEHTQALDEGEILVEENKCLVYVNPSIWWRPGFNCPIMGKKQEAVVARKVNPLKASKRKGGGK